MAWREGGKQEARKVPFKRGIPNKQTDANKRGVTSMCVSGTTELGHYFATPIVKATNMCWKTKHVGVVGKRLFLKCLSNTSQITEQLQRQKPESRK